MIIKQSFKKNNDLFLSSGNYVELSNKNITEAATNLFNHYKKALFDNKPSAISCRVCVGGDPEFFINKNNKPVPSYKWFNTEPNESINFGFTPRLMPVEKSQWAFDGFTGAGTINTFKSWAHPDGYQIELGYIPYSCMETTSVVIKTLFNNVIENLVKNNFELSNQTSIVINKNIANKIPLGCRPSFNAHFLDNQIYNTNPLKRFAGGHYHFSALPYALQRVIKYSNQNDFTIYDPEEINNFNSIFSLKNLTDDERFTFINPIIRAMDLTLGLFSVAVAGELDDPERRRHHYGMAGDYRITQNTIEYRTPSNITWQHPVLWHIMGMMGRDIVKAYLNPSEYNKATRDYFNTFEYYGEVIDIINNTDYKAARLFLNKYWATFIQYFFNTTLHSEYHKILTIANEGFSSLFDSNIKINWDKNLTLTQYSKLI